MMRTDQELKQLAVDTVEGLVFTNAHLRNQRDAPLVFMPLALMSAEQLAGLKDAALIYEYSVKAGPRSVNGLPVFTSFASLNAEEFEKFKTFAADYQRLRQEFTS